MLRNTFCHLPDCTLATEKRLWVSGISRWDEVLEIEALKLSRTKTIHLATPIRDSFAHLEQNNPCYFSELLPTNQHWRLFPEFRHTLAYLDIETTGLGYGDAITTIALYDGRAVSYYIQGENLEDFLRDIHRYTLLVTYNGKSFDVPFIERFFRTKLPHAHIDLMYVLRSLGYKGGLKGCEKQLGLDRGELAGVDGFFAVLLWNDYKKTNNVRALETLLAYNIQDVVNLETLLTIAYNMKIADTPFHSSNLLAMADAPVLPFTADADTICRLQRQSNDSWRYGWR
jgi:uncharacterized protein